MASRSRSRSPLERADQASPTPSTGTDSLINERRSSSKRSITDGRYFIRLVNVPHYWKWQNVMDYIRRQTCNDKATNDDVAYIHLSKATKHSGLEAVCVFKTSSIRHHVYKQCVAATEKVDGQKLHATLFNNASYINKSGLPTAAKKQKILLAQSRQASFGTPSRVSMNMNPDDENEMYGLSASYLAQLGISPPLKRWVFVNSIPEQYNDVARLRQLFGMAGTLITAQLLPKNKHGNICARLEYDHPVEAVQAVSMFNKQEVQGGVLRCEMDTLPKDLQVPRGPGLGPNGAPLRGARVAVEVKKVKSEIMTELQRVHDAIDELKAQVTSLMQASEQRNASQMQILPNPAPPLNVANPLATINTLLTNQLQPIQLLQNLMQQNSGTDLSALTNALQTLKNNQAAQPNQIANMQTGALPPVANMQGTGPNMQSMIKDGPNIAPSQFSNIPTPNNMQSAPYNMQGGLNMQGGPGGPNMQRGSNNMQGGPHNMQGGPNNMPGGPNTMHGGPNNMPGGPNTMQGGPNDMQGGPHNTQRGPNMHGGPNNVQQRNQRPFNQGSINDPVNNQQPEFSNMQPGHSTNTQRGPNMHGGPNNVQQGNQRPFNQGPFNGPVNNQQPEFSNMQPGHSNMQPGHYQQNNSGFGQQTQFSNNSNRQQEQQTVTASMLIFKNLPPSVNHQMLQAKMSEVGNVKLVEITGPGRALVSYYNDIDAEKCIRLFNESKVNGQVIEVRKV